MRWSHSIRSRDSRADTDRCRKCVTHFAECYFIITFCDMHNNCQQLDGTLLPLPSPHSSSSFSSVVAATVTINFRISAAFSQNEVVDIVRHVEPHFSIHMQGYVCMCVLEYAVIGTSWHSTGQIETGVSKRSGRRVLCPASY